MSKNRFNNLSPKWKILRLILFIIGFVSMFWFFFSFIGIVVGLFLYIFSNDKSWKGNGLVLAICSAFSNWIAHVSVVLAPLKLAAMTGPPIMVGYIVINIIMDILQKKGKIGDKFEFLDNFRWEARKSATVKLGFMLIPIILWSSVSINFGVMFDNSPQLLWIHSPTSVETSEQFNVTVESWDPYERLSAVYVGTVDFSIESYDFETLTQLGSGSIDAELPPEYTFTGQKRGSDIAYRIKDGKDNGRHVFQMTINTPGIHYLIVSDSVSGKSYYSNPIIVKDYSESNEKIYWGDLHTHSILSDGTGTPDHNFHYGRYIACLDYMALTDHGEILMWQFNAFKVIEAAINNANMPNEFVVFQGLEWTQVADGHYSCIFSGNKLLSDPVVSFLTVPETEQLWNILDEFTAREGCRALALPHHPTKKAYIQDWTDMNPKYVKIAEVCSVHGDFLYEQRDSLNYRGAIDPPPKKQNGTSITDALIMGKNLTLYAASDVHDGHPGHSICHTDAFVGHQRPLSTWHTRNEHPYPGGITAVRAESLTRDSVFMGLENQKIYACSDHGRPYLEFSINGTSVGSGSTVYANNVDDEREINVFIAQDGGFAAKKHQDPIVGEDFVTNWGAKIEILKNGELWQSKEIDGPIFNWTISDNEPIAGANYGSQSCINRNGQYYINEYSTNPVDPLELNTDGADFYIVRIVGNNGRHVYAGPIWVMQ
ncbi:MAG: DUF3604 domain-containing protein [Candidatus Lokiarchaeota archaeon]|nr:DUF3604 domain-containing protein [Candidatus Lokiarchaeota archaeon]